MLYPETHRDMWCKGFTNDEYWERTKKSAELIRAADPSREDRRPGHVGLDRVFVLVGRSRVSRGDTASVGTRSTSCRTTAKYGPFARDFMRRCAEYKKKTGKNLIDIFAFHGYPMTTKLDWGNRAQFANPSPELQEFRVRDVRKFWDESYRDPDTWMGKESWANGNVAYVPLMRRWMKEAGWDAPIAIGEYDYSGPEGGEEISAAVAQAESFAAFARTRGGVRHVLGRSAQARARVLRVQDVSKPGRQAHAPSAIASSWPRSATTTA